MYTYVVWVISWAGNVSIQHNPKVPFGVMLLIQRVQYLLVILLNKFLFSFVSFSFRYVVELKLLQNLKSETAWA